MSHTLIIFLTIIFSVRSLSYIIANASPLKSVNCDEGNRRKLYFSPAIDLNVSLTIESSPRASHQIVSYILKELLIKHLCFQNVTVRVRDNHRDIRKIHQSLRPLITPCGSRSTPDCFPEAMVNLEVWQPVGYQLIDLNKETRSYVTDVGPLGPIILPGFFIPEFVASSFWNESKLIMDHWRIFQHQNYARLFRSKVEGQSYKTSRCAFNEKCARLLVLDNLQQYFLGPISKYINETGLWIAPRVIKTAASLERLLRVWNKTLKPPYPFLLAWHPSPVTLKYKLILVSSCYDMWPNYGAFCRILQERRINKWIWRDLVNYAPHAVTTIKNMNFSQEDYVALLREVASFDESVPLAQRYKDIASKWIRNNKHKWMRWLPDVPAKAQLTIASIIPTDPFYHKYDMAMSEIVAELNNNTLRDAPFQLRLEVYNVSNDAGSALFAYNKINFMCNTSRHLVGMVVAMQSDVSIPLVHLSTRYKTVIMSPSVESLSKSYKEVNAPYPYFFRTIPDHSDYSEYLVSLLQHFKWRRVALFRQNGLIINKDKLSALDVVEDFKMEENMLNMEIVKRSLTKASTKERARIMVVDFKQNGTALFVCAAAQLNLVPERGFVWIFPTWMGYLHTQFFLARTMRYGCDRNKTFLINTYFVLTPHSFILHGYLRTQFAKLYSDIQKIAPQMIDRQHIIWYTYDALKGLAIALKKLIGKGEGDILRQITGSKQKEKFVSLLSSIRFLGNSGNVSFTSKNIRSSTTWVLFQKSLPTAASEKSLYMSFVSVQWEVMNGSRPIRNMHPREFLVDWSLYAGGKLPSDGSICEWTFFARHLNKSCEYSRDLSIGLIISGVILFVLLFFLCVYFCTLWYVKCVNARCPQPFSEFQEYLKDLEISRTALMLQYRLGEGAFGTVYYGELKIDGVWTGVAAKVLNDGASSDECREFLSEAIIMRDFAHRNVMSIIGVVSSAPNYVNVMEFMLLGDLRKYLLTRHNVAKNTPEHEDICPTTLTSMALDIARGLEYLQQKRLVHRDLACRNCLVDKQRRIKIGDFGMTRSVNDAKGYYRFDRQGLLPVRWMAPESIQSRIFNFTTDVWSFGVVMYEIVTFGNQPYRGRTNEEVLDFMKRCTDSLANYLVKPKEKIPGLYDLMLSCWSLRAEARPLISFVIQRLEVNPDCVRPCLDESPPHPGETRPRGHGADRGASVFSASDLAEVPVSRGPRGSAGGGLTSASSSERTRVASGNRVSSDMRFGDSMGRVNNLTSNSFTNSIASRLGFIRDNSSRCYPSGGSNSSNPKRHTCSQEFLSYSRHHSGDQEISTVSDPHGYQMEYDPLVLSTTPRSFAANTCNSGYSALPNEVHRDGERRSSSGGQRDDDDVDADQQTLLKMSRT